MDDEQLSRQVIADIVLAEEPWTIIRTIRKSFHISQRRLAQEMGISSSVISDYESGRRKSPGINMIKRLVTAMVRIRRGI